MDSSRKNKGWKEIDRSKFIVGKSNENVMNTDSWVILKTTNVFLDNEYPLISLKYYRSKLIDSNSNYTLLLAISDKENNLTLAQFETGPMNNYCGDPHSYYDDDALEGPRSRRCGNSVGYFTDDYLEVRDVKGNGNPYIFFHSKSSSTPNILFEHFIAYPIVNTMVDNSKNFQLVTQPIRNGLDYSRWIDFNGYELYVTAQVVDEDKSKGCRYHYLLEDFKHEKVRINNRFSFFSERYFVAVNPLDKDKEFIASKIPCLTQQQ